MEFNYYARMLSSSSVCESSSACTSSCRHMDSYRHEENFMRLIAKDFWRSFSLDLLPLKRTRPRIYWHTVSNLGHLRGGTGIFSKLDVVWGSPSGGSCENRAEVDPSGGVWLVPVTIGVSVFGSVVGPERVSLTISSNFIFLRKVSWIMK